MNEAIGLMLAGIAIAAGIVFAVGIAAETVKECRGTPLAREVFQRTVSERDATIAAQKRTIRSKDELIHELRRQLDEARRPMA